MNNPVISTFQQASFRGIPFLFTEQDQHGGRKKHTYEYPNRDTRFVKDLGRFQKIYRMKATIADSTSNYQSSKDRFIQALEAQGKGVLVHPTDGIRQVFLSEPYALNESISHIGTATFDLVFEETGEQTFPDNTPSNASNILQKLNNFINLINTDVSNIWGVVVNVRANVEYSASLIFSLGQEFQNAGAIVNTEVEAYSKYLRSLNELNDHTYSYPTNADAFSSNVQELFNLGGQLTSNNLDRLSIFSYFFNYESAPSFESTTVGTDERKQNQLILNQLINAQSLVYYYQTVSITSFETEEDIEAQHKLMNEQFINIILNNIYTDVLGNSFELLSNDTLSLLETLRFNAHQSLNLQLTSARRIVDINIKSDSLLPLVYNYYGDLEFYDAIYFLNDLTSAANLSGDFKVLSDES